MNLDTFQCIEMAVFDMTTLTGSFEPLNTASQQPVVGSEGFQDSIKVLKLYNDGDTGITLSYNGIVPHDYLPAKGTQIIDLQANHASNSAYGSGTLNGRKGQYIYGLGTASTAGNLYISGYR